MYRDANQLNPASKTKEETPCPLWHAWKKMRRRCPMAGITAAGQKLCSNYHHILHDSISIYDAKHIGVIRYRYAIKYKRSDICNFTEATARDLLPQCDQSGIKLSWWALVEKRATLLVKHFDRERKHKRNLDAVISNNYQVWGGFSANQIKVNRVKMHIVSVRDEIKRAPHHLYRGRWRFDKRHWEMEYKPKAASDFARRGIMPYAWTFCVPR